MVSPRGCFCSDRVSLFLLGFVCFSWGLFVSPWDCGCLLGCVVVVPRVCVCFPNGSFLLSWGLLLFS